jgi:hypothetical protein|tara:strand:- start:3 stop:473 length:471 start_codon:yes stop_codon:yes gene_type:complete
MKNSIFIILIIILTLNSCTDSKNINQLDSDDFVTKTERIKALKTEIKSQSEFNDAEFELFNVNGFSKSRESVPGASSLDYRFVIKVKNSDIEKWTEGMTKIDLPDENINWTKDIIEKRKNEWSTKSLPEFYNREKSNVLLIVYRDAGIIYKRVINK